MTFQEWQEFATTVRTMATRITRNRHEIGFKIAADAGIDRGCIHNCSIATIGQGWGANPGGIERIKAAKRARHFVMDFSADHIADRVIERAWNQVSYR